MQKPHRSNEDKNHARRTAALRGLRNSLLINVLCPYLAYRILEPHFDSRSVMPLGTSGLVPLVNLAHGLLRRGFVDVIALFAAEDVIVSITSALLAHTPMMALVGRSLQNAVLGLIFMASLMSRKPLMLYVARQFVTGNEPVPMARFDQMAKQSDAIHIYRVMTLIWALALFGKSAVAVVMALSLSTNHYLVLTPLVTYGSDVLLALWSFRYGYSNLGHYAAAIPPEEPAGAEAGS